MFDPLAIQEPPRLHEWNIIQKPKSVECDLRYENFRRMKKPPKGHGPVTWTVSDIAKAGCLLNCPPLKTSFEDEQEMRRVYSLIYDVYRYKYVLTQALNDINFFATFPKLSSNEAVAWLLFYDLYHRNFHKRETCVAPLAAQLFDAHGFSYPENALWSQKIRLAAAVARLRIKNNALSLSEMLPPHLKDEKVTKHANTRPVSCWINLQKTKNDYLLCQEIERCFGLRRVTDNVLNPHMYKWDRHCPETVVFHSALRSELAKSRFVKDHSIIVQDKSFCFGPATFKKILTDLELTGSVIQTHVNSPRTTAYLATLLSQNDKIKNLLAFSAGKRKAEYEMYFNELGMSNIKLFSDRLIDTAPDAHYMEEVVAVYATPPNSYSAVADPIDLVCSRGGDLSMLEILTETGDSKEARERIAAILDEQQKTLRFAMSRPQIQFVLYETHSELDAENCCMVNMTLKEINKIAKLHHASLQGKLCAPHPSETALDYKGLAYYDDEASESSLTTPSKITVLSEMTDEQERFLESIQVPDTDQFDQFPLPMLCDNEKCKMFACPGCYLAYLKRKEVIRLDDKYMIKMAEQRGLFGAQSNDANIKSKSSKTSRKKIEKDEKTNVAHKKFADTENECYECSTQTRDKFVRQPVRVYQLSDSEDNLVLVNPSPVIIKPVKAQRQGKYTQSPSLHRFSLARLQRENEKPIPECEHFFASKKKKDVSILVQPSSKPILSKLSSAHIRQFVSPFYKQLDTPNVSGPSLTEIFKMNLQEESEKFTDILTRSQKNCVQTNPRLTKKKIVLPKIDSPVVQYEIPRLRKKMKRIDKIISRLSTPTHSSRARSVPGKEPKKEAVKEPPKDSSNSTEEQEVPECKHCHLRDMRHEKDDPTYDELQDYLDKLQPIID